MRAIGGGVAGGMTRRIRAYLSFVVFILFVCFIVGPLCCPHSIIPHLIPPMVSIIRHRERLNHVWSFGRIIVDGSCDFCERHTHEKLNLTSS